MIHLLTYNIRGLPWVKCPVQQIGHWLGENRFPILCLQEVFTNAARLEFEKILPQYGYRVLRPRDEETCPINSGLLVAFHESDYEILSTCFQSYRNYRFVDCAANKGFFRIRVLNRRTGQHIHIVNTHMQSDTEVSWVFGRRATERVRRKQAEEILDFFKDTVEPVLVIGDLNQETILHPYLRSLHPPSSLPLKKSTFFKTGEDLDHAAFLPLQWVSKDCGFCGPIGPKLQEIRVHTDIVWSDHAPVEMKITIPPPS
jgi:endonuclease/exonuclease/phosphatase family metal-dependent hydrolase